jgi:hypothetical protein
MFTIDLGEKVEDLITGFTGTVTGRCEYISGCAQYLLTPRIKADGSYMEGRWFDEDRLTAISEKMVDLAVSRPGPDCAAPVK